ncbi:MAG: circularly permuted type 2 ATP-grasp protein [Desulfobacterales bacterium]|jgi:uncharacterized circularly permuted ATP-grasp superfamily protein/uncharacterized alpha-E superfamily protein
MTTAGPTDRPEQRSERPSLFAAVSTPAGAYDEAFLSPTTPRGHWQPLVDAIDEMGPALLGQRQDRARRMRHEDGATYNPFDDAGGRGIPWALEVIPMPLTADRWTTLEAGLIQRAQLLEQLLADVYGPQKLLAEGRIPPALVFANPNFLRTCHGIRPAGDRFLTYYAADLYRGRDGNFRVFRDYAANPAGLGYALENRIVVSRIFPDLYHQAQIHRLAPFFQTFQRALSRRASFRREEPATVLLSPGPSSRIYFEHALLSRYLGYPVVEGQDLTVRNGEVFLKKLAGLEPVDSIFRQIGDAGCDSFALRREASGGVAGLIQVARERNIDIVNPIGSGFVDTPALAAFLPALCRQLTGEDLLLENHPVRWCGTPDGLKEVLARLERLSLGPAMERKADGGPAPTLEAVRARPHLFVGNEPILPARVPAWGWGRMESRPVLLRMFACATENGFAVMPGALAVSAADEKTLTGDVFERQQSKDVWVLSDRPVVPFSLMSGLQTVPEFRRDSDLPSRAADHLLWLGRYLERAEGLVRLLRSVFRRLSGEARSADIPELPFLLDLLRAEQIIPPVAGNSDGLPRYRELLSQLTDALYAAERPETVVSVLWRVQEAARNVRDRLSVDSWRVINRLEGFSDSPASDPLELLDDTLFTLSAFSGLAMESMTRGLGWRFMDIGRRVERAVNQARLIRTGLPQACTGSRGALEALLEIFDSIMTYRARYRTVFQPAPVLDLLLADRSNPKALAFQIGRLAAHVKHLPRHGEPQSESDEEKMTAEMLGALRRADLSGPCGGRGKADPANLAAFLEAMENRLKEFAQQVGAHYLTRVPSTPHFSMIGGSRGS